MSTVELTTELWRHIWPECEPLMRQHEEEVGLNDERVPFEIDVESAEAMDRVGMLYIVAARDYRDGFNGVLVGYGIWYLTPNLASRDVKLAAQGPWFVLPEWRGEVGGRIWKKSLADLKRMGVQLIHVHHSERGDGPKLADFFARQGAKLIESVYAMWIGDE